VAPRLHHIDEQLRDQFGAGYRLHSDAVPGIGTTITLRVPASYLTAE
jgi:hypothetical protein